MSENLYTGAQMREAMMLSAKHLHGVTDLDLYVNQHIDNLTPSPKSDAVREAVEVVNEAYRIIRDAPENIGIPTIRIMTLQVLARALALLSGEVR